MKIIAGRLRGRKLKTPKGLTTRPVLARVREALFNVLGNIEGARVLDLYAGTGAVGIEALSRGARSLVAVDIGYKQCRVIRENLSNIGMDAVVIRSSVKAALEKLPNNRSVFDFIFADPPYERGMAQKTVVSVFNKELLSDSGVMALTVHRNEELLSEEDNYAMIFDRSYGETRLVIYKMKQ